MHFSDNKDGTKKPSAEAAPPSSGSGQQSASGESAIRKLRQSVQAMAITEPAQPVARQHQQQQARPALQQQHEAGGATRQQPVARSEPKQRQQQPLQQQHQAGGPIHQTQQQPQRQQRPMSQQPPWTNQPHQQSAMGKMDRPPAQDRDRTRNQPQPKNQQERPSQPTEPPRNVPSRAESTQSTCSSASKAHGGAIPKASAAGNLRELPPLPKKSPGTRGKELGLIETNYLQLDFSKIVPNAYKYDVEITGRPRKFYLSAFLQFCAQFLPDQRRGISYDWKKIAVANCRLPIDGELEGDVQVRHPDTGKLLDYKIVIKPAGDGASVPIKSALAR